MAEWVELEIAAGNGALGTPASAATRSSIEVVETPVWHLAGATVPAGAAGSAPKAGPISASGRTCA